jgi:hypothetical protein
MKKDNRGENAKPIPGLTSNPKPTPNHGTITNVVNSPKEVSNQGLSGSALPPPKK